MQSHIITTLTIGLLHFSLLGGFGSPQIVKILESTGNFSTRTKAQLRLLHTLEWVLDIHVCGSLEYGSEGYKSTKRVRRLHAAVGGINLKQIIATQVAFAAVYFDLATRFTHISDRDLRDILAVWAWIGKIVGIPDKYNACLAVERTKDWAEALWCDLVDPKPSPIVDSVLDSFGARDFNVSILRIVHGDLFANDLGIEKCKWYARTLVELLLFFIKAFGLFEPTVVGICRGGFVLEWMRAKLKAGLNKASMKSTKQQTSRFRNVSMIGAVCLAIIFLY